MAKTKQSKALKETKPTQPRAKPWRDWSQEAKYDRSKGLTELDTLVAMSTAAAGFTGTDVEFLVQISPGDRRTKLHLRKWMEAWRQETRERNVTNARSIGARIPPPANSFGFSRIDDVWVAYGLPSTGAAGILYFVCDAEGGGPTVSRERVMEVVSAQRAARDAAAKERKDQRAQELEQERQAVAQMFEAID